MQSNQAPTILAIDYGHKRVGLALARTSLAEPLTILDNDSGLWAELWEICEREGVGRIVIGISEGTMAEQTRSFVERLRGEWRARSVARPEPVAIPSIEFFDETLTTAAARAKLHSPAFKHSRRFAHLDHLAAASLLQEWLDARPAGS